MGTAQTRQHTKMKQASEKAKARVAELREEAEGRQRRKRGGEYSFTAEEITRQRDELGLSWRQVAVNLDLSGPSAARTAYTALTGRPHHESLMTGKRASTRGQMGSAKMSTRKVDAPTWDDDTDQDEIIERLTGSRIIVRRTVRDATPLEEDILVGRIVRFTFDGPNGDGPLVVHFNDRETMVRRSVRVADIKEVR